MAHQHLSPPPCPDLIAQDEMIEMLKYAAPNEGTRHASEEAHKLWNQAWGEFNHYDGIYHLLQAVKDRSENLPAEPAKYLNELLADFLRCSHGRYLKNRNLIDR